MRMSFACITSKAAPVMVTAALLWAEIPADQTLAQVPQVTPVMGDGPTVPPLVNIGRYFVNPLSLTYGFRKQGGGWTVMCRGRVTLDLTEEEGQRLVAMQPPRVGRYYINPLAVSHAFQTQGGGWSLGFDDGSSVRLSDEEGRDLIRLMTQEPSATRAPAGIGVTPPPAGNDRPMRTPVAPSSHLVPMPAGSGGPIAPF